MAESICALLCFICGLYVNVAMVLVGSSYSDCNLYVLLWLEISGGVGVGTSILLIIMNGCRCPCFDEQQEDSLNFWLRVMIGFTHISMMIWGSVVTFGPYWSWIYNSQYIDDPNYCNYTPYMLAYVVLNMFWIALALACCCICSSGVTSSMYYQKI